MSLIWSLFPGSPSLPDKAKHNREVMMLLPSHRERANNMYYNMAENGQVRLIDSAVTMCGKNRWQNVKISQVKEVFLSFLAE